MAAEQQRFRGFGGGIDENAARRPEDTRQFLAQFFAQLIVEIRQGLIHQHQIGPFHQRAGNRRALLLTAGKL